jgi:predicted MFS family arabinose efflux permease
LILACVIGGLMATVTAQCIALAGRVQPERPGLAVGGVVMGVSIGILAGRVGGGALGQWLGWRVALAALALGLLVTAGLAVRGLPHLPALSSRLQVRDLLLSAPRAMRRRPGLLQATLVGCCWFAAFSVFWSSLALYLAGPPFCFGAAAAGAFGVIGIVGAIIARVAGHAADRFGARAVVFAGLVAAAAGFLLLAALPHSLVAIIIATLLLDAGCFAAHAATQAHILQTNGDYRSQAYGAYMVVYWTAGTLGAFAGPALFGVIGWCGESIFAAGLILVGVAIHAKRRHLMS